MVTTGWTPAQVGRVIGASHRRQGSPCQDAVVAQRWLDREGTPLELMAVADGHGGSRYWLSDVGSRLACEQAAAAIRAELATRPLSDDGWDTWLRDALPPMVQGLWLTAIEADWASREQAHGSPFSPLTYGTTLGLVLMAPRWWAVGGIGDWDLLEVDCEGQARLMNEETDLGGGGEATGSLCLGEAASLWRQRCQLVVVEAGTRPFSLLLSSDGLRKSCATDGDYRILGAYLCRLDAARVPGGDPDDEPVDLEAALNRITEQGSGDDVSVAIGRWNEPAPAPLTEVGASTADPEGPEAQLRSHGTPGRASLALRSLAILLLVAVGAIALVRGQQPADPDPAARVPPQPRKDGVVGAAGLKALQATITDLCRSDPSRRRAILRNRRSQFEQLGRDSTQRSLLIEAAAQDPLGALIALQQPQPPTPMASPGGLQPPTPAPPLRSCPELDQQLANQWRDATPGLPPIHQAPAGPGGPADQLLQPPLR